MSPVGARASPALRSSRAATTLRMDTPLTADEALAYAEHGPALAELCERALERAPGPFVTFSPKVFIPLTHLCRDVCHYCTFARPPRRGERCYLTPDEVLAVAAAGPRGRLPRGPLHARRQARAALPRRARGARPARLPDHRRLSGALRGARAARDGSAAARQSRHPRRRRAARPARGLRVAGDHARDRERAAVAARRGRTSARPTSCRRCASTRSTAPGASRSRTRAAS